MKSRKEHSFLIETFLINLVFLVLPVLLFVIFFDQSIKEYHFRFAMIFYSLAMILCMVYPVRLEIGFIVDLRYVPFTLVALYGGYRMAFPLYIVLNLFRLFIGGEGILQSFLFSTFIFLTIPWISKQFNQSTTKERLFLANLVILWVATSYLGTLTIFYEELNREFWTITFYVYLSNLLMMNIVLVLNEKLISNIKNRETYLRMERLHVMNELSASVSHEIRNPLTVVNGFLQLLSVSKNITPEDGKYINYSLEELKRAENILNDYLAFTKPHSANMVFSDLKQEVDYVINIIMPFARLNNVEIDFQFSNTLKKRFDQNQMKQCLVNLMKNSIEAMSEQGGVLSVQVLEAGTHINIQIQDTGVGMTKTEINQLGKPYYSNKKEGTGLGMLMVYGALSEIKGTLEVESKKGVGTTFTISIPT